MVIETAEITAALTKRYRDAYLHATTIVGLGVTIKILAIVLGSISAIGGMIAGNSILLFLGVISGATTGAIIYLIGVGVAAQGQILRATLDSAVNSSPFLENDQRAEIMSLSSSQGGSADSSSQGGHAEKVANSREDGTYQCELCNGKFPSRYYLVANGETKRLLCLECDKTLSDDQTSDFMRGREYPKPEQEL